MKKEKLLLTAFIFSVIMFFIIMGIEKSKAQNINIDRTANVYDNSYETFIPMGGSYIISSTSYFTTYEILFKNTKLKQPHCKLIAFGASLLSGYLFYKFDSNDNFGPIIFGSLFAGASFSIGIGFDKKRDLKRKLVKI